MKQLAEPDLTSATINEITAKHPETITVFNDFGVDACCGGDATLSQAAERDGVSVSALTDALQTSIASADEPART